MSLEKIIKTRKQVIDGLAHDLIGGGREENQRKILSDNPEDNLNSTKGSDVFRAFERGYITPEEYSTFKKNKFWGDTTTKKFFEWYLEDYHRLDVPTDKLFNTLPIEVNILNKRYSNIENFDAHIKRAWTDEKNLILNYLPKLELVEYLMQPILESNPDLNTKKKEVLDNILQKELESNRLDKYSISLIKREWPELNSRKDIAEQYLTHLNKEIKNLKIKIPGEGLFSKIRNSLNEYKGLYGILCGVAIAGITGSMAINHLANIDRPDYNNWNNLSDTNDSYIEDTVTMENNSFEDWVNGPIMNITYDLENVINTENQIVSDNAVEGESIVDSSPDNIDELEEVAPKTYTIQRGDTLTEIARDYIQENNLDLSLSEAISDIAADNNISHPDIIQIGDQLTIDFSNLENMDYSSGIETEVPVQPEIQHIPSNSNPDNAWIDDGGNSLYNQIGRELESLTDSLFTLTVGNVLDGTNPGWENSNELWQDAINLFNIPEEVETYQSTEGVSLQEDIETLHYSPDFTRNCEVIEINLNQRLNNLESIWEGISLNRPYNIDGIQIDEIEWNSQMDEFETLISQYEQALDPIISAEEMLYKQQIQNLPQLGLTQEVSFADTVNILLDTLAQETNSSLENTPTPEINFQNLEWVGEKYPEIIPYDFQKVEFPQNQLFESDYFNIRLQGLNNLILELNIIEDTLASENVNYSLDNIFNYESDGGLSSIVWDEQLNSSNHQEIILAGSQSSGSGGISNSPQQPVIAETNINIGIIESKNNFYNSGIDAISIYQVADEDIRIQINPLINGFSISDYSLVLGNSDLQEISRIPNLNGILEVGLSDFEGNTTINQGDQYVMVLKGVLRDPQGFSMGSPSNGIDITSEWFNLRDYSGIDTRLDE